MSNTLKDSLEDAIWYALDAEQGAPHSGVDMTVVVEYFIKYLAHRGYAVVDGARAILVPTSEMCAACEALDESDDCSCVCHLRPVASLPLACLPEAKVETIFDILARLVETLSTREAEASTIAASAAELGGTPAPYWRGLAEGYKRGHLAVSQIITDAQTDDADDPYPRGLTEWDRDRYRTTGGLHPAEICGEDCSGCCDE